MNATIAQAWRSHILLLGYDTRVILLIALWPSASKQNWCCNACTVHLPQHMFWRLNTQVSPLCLHVLPYLWPLLYCMHRHASAHPQTRSTAQDFQWWRTVQAHHVRWQTCDPVCGPSWYNSWAHILWCPPGSGQRIHNNTSCKCICSKHVYYMYSVYTV